MNSLPSATSQTAELVSYSSIDRLQILLVIESTGGGSGRHVIDLAGGLAGLGHSVTVAFSPLRAERGFVASLDELNDVSSHSIVMHRAFGWRDARAVIELRKFIRERGPFDIVHAHSSKAGAVLRLAIPGINANCIYTPHALVTLDNKLSFARKLLYAAAERILSLSAHRIICVSEEEAAHAERIGLPSRKLRVAHNGLAPLAGVDRAQMRTQLGIANDAVCLGAVGRLSEQKDVGRLIHALALLNAALPQLHLVIVGEGPQRAQLELLAQRIGVFDRTHFIGQGDGPAIMAAFDIFALSSRYEAFPYVLLEAAARGLPIVMTQVGGAAAMVDEGQNGFVVPQDDTEQLARRISQLYGSAELRRQMGEKSLQIVKRFGLQQMLVRTLEIYREVLRLRT